MNVPLMGILTGISYQSGIDYYKNINEQYMKLIGPQPKTEMPPNPLMLMSSVDCEEYCIYLLAQEWKKVSDHLCRGVELLVKANIDFLVIASNTGHMAVPEIRRRWPTLKILHIADSTADAIKSKRLRKVGLIGTTATMHEAYIQSRLATHHIETITPEHAEDRKQIFEYIRHELGFGIFKSETRKFFVDQMDRMVARGAEGVILGCTEIELLVQQKHCDYPLFPSAELHIEAASSVLTRRKKLLDFLPSSSRL